MTAYVLAQLSIHDPERYAAYATSFLETLSPYDGRLLVADDSPDVGGRRVAAPQGRAPRLPEPR